MATLLNNEHASFKNLVLKAQTFQQIGKKLQEKLDPCFQGHMTLASINNGVATILTESSAWATRLRYLIPDILDVLNNQPGMETIKTVRIKMVSPQPEKPVAHGNRPQISNSTANFLKETANCFSDSELRETLLKIAGHQKNKNA